MAVRAVCAISVSLLALVSDASAFDVVDRAAGLIGRPYVWGADGPNAFDCSGLTRYIFREFGVEIPRRAVNQSTFGDSVGSRLRRGDLVFFTGDANGSGPVSHVGIYEGAGMMINASKRHGRVLRESLNDLYWVKRFVQARRVTAGGENREAEAVARPRPDDSVTRPRPDRKSEAARIARKAAEALFRRAVRRPPF